MKCEKCPRHCSIDDNSGKLGFCQAGKKIKLGLVMLHKWEEPCISGINGSGTIFFSGCNLRCCFCQNYKISQLGYGKEVTIERLSNIMLELQAQQAHNINLVTPAHYSTKIIKAIYLAKVRGLKLPIIYNTNSYETIQNIRQLAGYVDVFLPDIKYFNNTLSQKYSLAPNYFYHAFRAIEEMVSQTGTVIFNTSGIIQKGVIVRHLILPGCIGDSKKILKYLYNAFGNTIYISLMNQFTPLHHCKLHPEINRTLTHEEYNEVIEYALDLGFENGFIQQENTSTTFYVPDFNLNGI